MARHEVSPYKLVSTPILAEVSLIPQFPDLRVFPFRNTRPYIGLWALKDGIPSFQGISCKLALQLLL